MNFPQMRQCAAGALLFAAMLCVAPTYSWAQTPAGSSRRILVKTAVVYPSLARSMMLRGSVKVEAKVAANGTVKSVEVKGGHPMLAQSAMSAVRQWKFEPADRETREQIEIRFDPDH